MSETGGINDPARLEKGIAELQGSDELLLSGDAKHFATDTRISGACVRLSTM
jgi:hypothetical protein